MSIKSVYTNELKYDWLGNSWLKSVLSSVDSQKVLLRPRIYPQITMVPTQLSLPFVCSQKPSQSGLQNFVLIIIERINALQKCTNNVYTKEITEIFY